MQTTWKRKPNVKFSFDVSMYLLLHMVKYSLQNDFVVYLKIPISL